MKYTYCFNQLRDNEAGEALLFLNYKQTVRKGGVDLKNYWTPALGTIEASSPLEACEELYRRYNTGHGYYHRSMSVSDVVELWPVDETEGQHTAWFCDSCGFVQLQLEGEDMGVKSEFEIILPTGETVYITAYTRREAIREYCSRTGCPEEFVKKHCVVRNKGRSV